jgi:hypothetical protein
VRPLEAERRLWVHEVLGYHPILATSADTREVLHIRLARDQRTRATDAAFTDELIARVARTGASGVKLLRAGSGFCTPKSSALGESRLAVLDRCAHANAIREVVQAIGESAWQTIEGYPKEGEAQIAETSTATGG